MRALAAAVALAVAVSAAVAVSEKQERDLRDAMAYARSGRAALEKGNVVKAREAFDKALAKMPGLPDGHVGLGHLAMRERRFGDALREYRAAEAAYRTMASLLLEMENDRYAKSQDELLRLRGTLARLDQEAGLNQSRGGAPSGSQFGMSPGDIEKQRTEISGRIRVLEAMRAPGVEGVREPPAEVFFFEGNALFNLKKIDDAIVAWELSVSKKGDYAVAYNNLAVAYWMKGRVADARAAMARAEALGFRVNPSFRADLEKASKP